MPQHSRSSKSVLNGMNNYQKNYLQQSLHYTAVKSVLGAMPDGMKVANTDVPATNLKVGLTTGLPTLVSIELLCETIFKVETYISMTSN